MHKLTPVWENELKWAKKGLNSGCFCGSCGISPSEFSSSLLCLCQGNWFSSGSEAVLSPICCQDWPLPGYTADFIAAKLNIQGNGSTAYFLSSRLITSSVSSNA